MHKDLCIYSCNDVFCSSWQHFLHNIILVLTCLIQKKAWKQYFYHRFYNLRMFIIYTHLLSIKTLKMRYHSMGFVIKIPPIKVIRCTSMGLIPSNPMFSMVILYNYFHLISYTKCGTRRITSFCQWLTAIVNLKWFQCKNEVSEFLLACGLCHGCGWLPQHPLNNSGPGSPPGVLDED